MLPVLHIGRLAIQTPGLVLLVGIWLGLWLSEKKCTGSAIKPETINNLEFAGLIAMVVGGRLAYSAEHLTAFIKSPGSLVSLNLALFDLPAGLVIGLVVSIWYAIRHRLEFLSLLDTLTPGLAMFMVALSLADLASGNAYGKPVHLPWSIFLWGEWRHPTQIYDLIGSLIILLFKVIIPLYRKPGNHASSTSGLDFLEFTAWSATLQVFLGAYRGDGYLVAGQVYVLQVASWFVLAACLVFLGWRRKQARGSSKEKEIGLQ